MFDIPSRLVAAGRPLRPLARRHGAKSAAAPPFLRRVIHSLSPVCTPAHLGSCAPDLRRLVPDRTPDRTEREAAALRSLSAFSQKGDTQSLTGLHPGAPWQLCTGPAETCAGSHPRSHREGGCGPKGPFSLRGVSGCVFSIAPLGPYLNTLSVTFYSQNGYFESIFHHKYADDRKIPQNRPAKFVNKNPPAEPGDFYY